MTSLTLLLVAFVLVTSVISGLATRHSSSTTSDNPAEPNITETGQYRIESGSGLEEHLNQTEEGGFQLSQGGGGAEVQMSKEVTEGESGETIEESELTEKQWVDHTISSESYREPEPSPIMENGGYKGDEK